MGAFNIANKCKGSISLFLSIILLPMLTFTGLIVDSANLNLSKSVVESAGELATNAALANYDTVLNEVYGLFASSQSYSDLSKNLETYFDNTLNASGLLNETTSQLGGLSDDLKDFLGSTTSESLNKNFLNISYEDFTASGVAGSSLRNTKILKNQIIEFMKYRGPAEIGMDLFASTATFESAEYKSTVLAEKTDVDTAKSSLSNSCGNLYKFIKALDNRIFNFKSAEKRFEDDKESLNDKIKLSNEKILKVLYYAPDLSQAIYMTKTTDIDSDTSPLNYYVINGAQKAQFDTHKKLDEEFNKAIDELDELSKNLSTEFETIGTLPEEREGEVYSNFVKYLVLLKDIKGLQMKMFDFCNADKYKFGLTKYEDETFEEYDKRVLNARIEYLDKAANVCNNAVFEPSYKLQQYYFPYFEAYKQKLIDTQKQIDSNLTEVHTVVSNYYDSAFAVYGMGELIYNFSGNMDISNIDYVINLCNVVKSELKAVQTENIQLEESNENYAANASQDDQYSRIKSEVAANKITFKESDIDEVITQLTAIKSYINKVIDRYAQYSFYGKPLMMLNGWKNALLAMKETFGDKGPELTKCDEYYKKYCPTEFYTDINNFSESSYMKQIKETGVKAGSATIGVPSFYFYLMSTYGGYSDAEKSDAGDNVAKNASDSNNVAQETVNADYGSNKYTFDTFKILTTAGAGQGSSDIGSVDGGNRTGILTQFKRLASTVKGIFKVLTGGMENAVDDLLLMEYIFENFSFATLDMEREDDPGNNVDSMELLSMTNEGINKMNNTIYGTEIEYMLEGYRGKPEIKESSGWWLWEDEDIIPGDGPEKNINTVKGSIFMIRFVMNVIYALSSSELREQTYSPAMAIQVATMGYFPYKIAQIIIEIILALCESVYDVNHLMKGEEMPLYKSSDNWVYQMSGSAAQTMLNKASGFLQDKAKELAGKAIDSVSNYIQDCLNDAADWAEEEVGDVTSKITGEVSTAMNTKLSEAFSSMTQVVENFVEEEYTRTFTSGEVFDSGAFEYDLRVRLKDFVSEDSPYGDKVKDYLSKVGDDLVDKVMDSSVITFMQQSSDNANKNNNSTNSIDEGMYRGLTTCLNNVISDYIKSMESSINAEANTLASEGIGEAKDYLSGDVDSASDAAKQWSEDAVDKLADNVNKTMNENFGEMESEDSNGSIFQQNESADDSSKEEDSSMLGSILDFSYKDYLRLFVFLALSGDEEESILSRLADVIEMNVKSGLKGYYARNDTVPAHPAGAAFSMHNAYTYVEISATIKVKPLLLSQSVFTGALGNSPISFWTYKYSNIAGY